MVIVRERRPEMALMFERSEGENVYTAGRGQGRRPTSFGAHILYFLMTLWRWYNAEYIHSEVSTYELWFSWPDSWDCQCALTCLQATE